MSQRTHGDDQDRSTEATIYLPAGVPPPFDASRFERLCATLFNHTAKPPK